MDKATLFEQALHQLGDREYVRDSPTGKECDLWFPTVLHEALTFGAWSFATREAVLASKDNVCRLPDDCLRVLKVSADHFDIAGRELTAKDGRCNGKLKVLYISNSLAKGEALPDYQPLFVRGVMLLLASRIATKVTGDLRVGQVLEQEAKSVLTEALHKDALQSHSNDQHPLEGILKSSIIF